MKTNVALALATVLVSGLAFTANSFGQDVGLFNGNGIKNQWGNQQQSSKTQTRVVGQNATNVLGGSGNVQTPSDDGKWKLPKIDFSKLKPNFSKPRFMQDHDYPQSMEFSDTEENRLLPSFPRMEWPSFNSSQPNFFQRMNDRTREMFGKTRDGFSTFGERSRNTWDSLTRGLGMDQGAFGNRSTPPPAQPQLRSARQADGSTSRFTP